MDMEPTAFYWISISVILLISACTPFIVDHQMIKRGMVLTSLPISLMATMFCPLLVFVITVGVDWVDAVSEHYRVMTFCLYHGLFWAAAYLILRAVPIVRHVTNPAADQLKQRPWYGILLVELSLTVVLILISSFSPISVFPDLIGLAVWLMFMYPVGYILLLAGLGLGCGYLFSYEKKRNLNKVDDEPQLNSEESEDNGPGWDVQNPKYG
jgi:hypothetical protein